MQIAKRVQRVEVVDSHTAGEPTRLVLSGGPDLGNGPLADRLERFRTSHDYFRSAVVNEPRGSEVLVGALLCEPADPSCDAGVIFFNNVGYLGMCGHGTIGVVVSLAYLGKLQPGTHRIETPVGVVSTRLHDSGKVTVENVPSYRSQKCVAVNVPGYGRVSGDVAWGGNWFYLMEDHGLHLDLRHVSELTDFAWAVKSALAAYGVTGENGSEIDHIELFAPPQNGHSDSRNFVLCPGKAYDRSPCGTGTSAKMACMYAEGQLAPGQIWRQEGILDTIFEGSIQIENGLILPSITSTAYVTAESSLILDADDPFRLGIVP
ncbi:proline racemase family protein [Alloacidobacterium dinghuense]|uniref:Proline racemase family protein n=1 Tax=Alloacidobacterium dinghuense TaxID=2763107 RepID=A0A7G8BLW8_9BACT|nr:proline racemase family protein [Alloacidobacterium dinghuense]QNI33538.1 proline racemase family protein [Alloacidobacterium dinghuense]